ncbi:hypothetical protein TNCV_1030301 [Trichonephila clavipes]|nr:hypothetical protein TNCV_1030301 [Trichonephila clavipes]
MPSFAGRNINTRIQSRGSVRCFDAAIPGYVRYSMVVDGAKGIYNLRIHNVQMDDEAEYQCQVSFLPMLLLLAWPVW